MINYDGYSPVIGLEVHAQLSTKSKLFSPAPNSFGQAPNGNIHYVCTAQPGSLPVLNKKAVEFAVRAALATHCEVQLESVFSRKNYFYPDLPKGYQISQFDKPIALRGRLQIQFEDENAKSATKSIGITRIHMEEDAGKSNHMAGYSLVDLNRAGTPLIEIVSEPDFRSAKEASAYLRKLHAILQYIEVCDGNLQEGNFRCDANVSVRPIGQKEFGTRAELKNINSFRFVEKAIEYEIHRQVKVLKGGGTVVQETRLYDAEKDCTLSMRAKEDAHDYRYFPEPDLPPLRLEKKWVDDIQDNLPELPEEKALRFVSDFHIPEYDAQVITSTKALSTFYEEAVRHSDNEPKLVSNWVMGEVLRLLKESEKEIKDCPFPPSYLGRLVQMIKKGAISSKIAKVVFEAMWAEGKEPEKIVEEKGLVQISDPAAIEKVIQEVIEKNPNQVAQYKDGKEKLFGFFVGQVMKATKGQANPKMVNDLVKKCLEGR